ncbi:hypothetical protein Tsubulata_015833 [Turnera subulata]|uniref:Uncharacterized protein n=1 Tax=Turnera subulata TaxID=218843 RepID=A0A9Q0GE14_9ROSI|nr:hypothetical protein Tsubulata_015833 [Turnera subulata]
MLGFRHFSQTNIKEATSIVDMVGGRMNFSKCPAEVFDPSGEIFLHFGNWGRDPLQNPLFPKNDSTEKFLKGPPLGISPRNALKDTFRNWSFKCVVCQAQILKVLEAAQGAWDNT